MKFYILLFIATAFCISFAGMAQETSLDFTRADCDSIEHHLYSELDAGNVIILDFVMLGCAPCLWATRGLDTVVSQYEITHPGRVRLYAMSYESTHTCKQMEQWRLDGGFPGVTLFTNGAEQVAYYGGMGMPTIVITGGQDHKVFYNGYGYAPVHDSLIIAAIDSALNYSPSYIGDVGNLARLIVYPTTFTSDFEVVTEKGFIGGKLILTDASGRPVLEQRITEEGRMKVSASHLPRGIYIAVVQGRNSLEAVAKLIRH